MEYDTSIHHDDITKITYDGSKSNCLSPLGRCGV